MEHNNWLAFTLSNPNHLSLFQTAASDGGGEPKLENFLGGSIPGNGNKNSSVASDEQIYGDSELKTIAAVAGFLTSSNSNGGLTSGGRHGENRSCEVAAVRELQSPRTEAGKKTVESFGHRTSIYRGVTRHRWTGRYEAHLWDNSCRREGQSRKGRQVYLGGYDKEEKAAQAYDLAALKYWGTTTTTNFPVINYERETEEMKNMTRQEFVASLRRRSSGFSRGASMYRGVTRHHQHGRWQARIGRVAGNKDLYLGTFSTQEEAAEAYDIAAIKFRGLNAVTNFDMSHYDVKSIANSNLPIGGMANKSKNSSDSISVSDGRSDNDHDISESSVSFAPPHNQPHPINSNLNFALPIKPDPCSNYWPAILGYGSNQITLATPSPSASHSSHLISSLFHSHGPHHYINNNMNANTTSFSPSGSSASLMAGCEPGSVGICNMIPYATPVSMTMTTNSGSGVGTHEGNSNSGISGNGISNWVAPNLHQYQSGKSNLSVFQTPIFGIE